ncbi:thermonuclease family protein [Rhizobium paknamense]|uniref:Endonuclease YncB(Thermonuclease family) n=1 Tax=Rhizobium paknamense TaxID=1206817 RepID=A0ABU0I9E2_9HYPH|nr:thermonuclease family protein [Rhizobium paknamense]MDQ0453891.1 endonuclease YncB(thermonuclease family) [Rhizobium paknamense]
MTLPYRPILAAVAVLALIAGVALFFLNRPDVVLTGPFIAADGETVLTRGARLRMKGYDAPELGQRCRREDAMPWPCGALSRAELQSLLAQAGVTCRQVDTDDLKRLVVLCDAQGRDIGAEMVRAGLGLNNGGYEAEEKEAQTRKAGLWSGSFERPEEWRRLHPRSEINRMDKN